MLFGRRLRLFLRLAPALMLAASATLAAAADPPGRVARLNDVEGSVTSAPAGDNEWTDAQVNRPLTRGDRLWSDRGTRAEFQVGSSAVRMDSRTRLDIVALDDESAQFSVSGGSVYVRVRSLAEGENFELDTPNLAFRAGYPGDYRIDVDTQQGTTRVTVHAGAGTVFGEGGQPLPIAGGQQITFRGRALAQVNAQESPPEDAFDRWAAERNRHEDQSVAARYVPREVVGYEQLDPHGQWRRTDAYGAVWVPQGLPAGWAPYRQGHWDWVEPWGWTWIDDAPWGFAPFHYGRWTQLDGQWAWVPGRLSTHPVYAPALAAFIGGSGDIAWFPLAPNEPWQPPYAASALYISNVNRNIPLAPLASYAYQRKPEALTAVALAQFQHGRPSAGGWWRVAKNVLTSATIVTPPLQQHAMATAARDVRPAPPPPGPVRQTVAQVPTPAAAPTPPHAPAAPAAVPPTPPTRPTAAALPATAAVKPPTPIQPVGGVTVTAHEERQREAARSARPTMHVARTASAVHGTGQLAGRSERARAEQTARAAHERHAQTARRDATERARRELAVRREAQWRRQALARRDELWRRQARARADEQLRREAHATQIDLARRVADHDAQVLREQRLKREEQARRAAQEQAQRDAWERDQQATSDQGRGDRPTWEQRQRARRPDLRQQAPVPPPAPWQRSSPIVNVGPTS